jgi:hypothetical protein
VIVELYGHPTSDWAQIVVGLVPLTIGAVLFGRFLHKYPAVDQEAMAKSGNHGGS